MKIKTQNDFTNYISQNLSWRKREITSMKKVIDKTNSEKDKASLRRAASAVLYAHWEGFVKTASEKYLEYVMWQRLRFCDLKNSFMAMACGALFENMTESPKNTVREALVKAVVNKQENRAHFPCHGVMSEKGNLSSICLKDILTTLGLSYSEFWRGKSLQIDEKLVATRHQIAHGENVDVSAVDYYELHQLTLVLLEAYRDLLENAVALESYRRELPSP